MLIISYEDVVAIETVMIVITVGIIQSVFARVCVLHLVYLHI